MVELFRLQSASVSRVIADSPPARPPATFADETGICRVITVGEMDNVLRLLKANLAAINAIEEIRDNVLHERGPMAEAGFDSDKVNAVIGIIDNATSALDHTRS